MSAAAMPRTAGAPISWGVCEAPGWGVQLAPADVFAEIAAAGYHAAEAGPEGYLPSDGPAMRSALDANGLALAGAFLPVALHTAERRASSVAALDRVLDRLAASPGAVLSLAVVGDRGDFAARETLTGDEWRSTLASLDDLALRASARGVPSCVHPHAGTAVERRDDLERVLEGSSIGICLDTGHLVLGDIDPVQVVRDAPGRIAHVHLKDVDAAIAAAWRGGAFDSYRDAVDAGLYRRLGDGDAGIADALQVLVASGYDGWLVIERDMSIGEHDSTSRAARIDAAIRERTWVELLVARSAPQAAAG